MIKFYHWLNIMISGSIYACIISYLLDVSFIKPSLIFNIYIIVLLLLRFLFKFRIRMNLIQGNREERLYILKNYQYDYNFNFLALDDMEKNCIYNDYFNLLSFVKLFRYFNILRILSIIIEYSILVLFMFNISTPDILHLVISLFLIYYFVTHMFIDIEYNMWWHDNLMVHKLDILEAK